MPFAIRVTKHFFGPKDVKSYVPDWEDSNRRAEFATRARAQGAADVLGRIEYYLAHNESGRPDYTVVRVR